MGTLTKVTNNKVNPTVDPSIAVGQAAQKLDVPFIEHSTAKKDGNTSGAYTQKWKDFKIYKRGLPVRGGTATFATNRNQCPSDLVGCYSSWSQHYDGITYFTPKATFLANVGVSLRFFENFIPQYVSIVLSNNKNESEFTLVDKVFVNLDRNGVDYLPELDATKVVSLTAGTSYWVTVKFNSTVDNSNDTWNNEENIRQFGFKTKYTWSITPLNKDEIEAYIRNAGR